MNALRVIAVSLLFASSMALSATAPINGSDIEYEVKGRGEHLVVFEAGAISGMSTWDSIWDRLPSTITAIRYSRKGEGGSSSCTGELTAKEYAADLHRLLNHLGYTQPFVSVSHSYGGKVARHYAARYPSQVRAMLLLDPINPKDVEIVEQLDPEHGRELNEQVKALDMSLAKKNGWCLIGDIWDKTPSLSFGDIADIPVTLIAGVKRVENPQNPFESNEGKRLWGLYQAEWVRQFPKGKPVVSKASGHFVHKDQPTLVLSELASLLEGGFEVGADLHSGYDTEKNRTILQQVQGEAEQLGVTPSALVLKKLVDSGIMPLVASSQAERVKSNLALLMR